MTPHVGRCVQEGYPDRLGLRRILINGADAGARMKHRIAAIPDDGIGKEAVPEGGRVLDAAVQFVAGPTPPRSSARAASRAGRG
jgi:hypothetical protein